MSVKHRCQCDTPWYIGPSVCEELVLLDVALFSQVRLCVVSTTHPSTHLMEHTQIRDVGNFSVLGRSFIGIHHMAVEFLFLVAQISFVV